MKAIEGLISILLVGGVTQATTLRGPNIHFDTDKAEIINVQTLKDFVHSIERGTDISVYCYTDSRADVAHNKQLASRRCEAVRNHLNGMDVRSYLVVGEDHPEVSELGSDKAGRRGVNRRVELYYQIKPAPVPKFKRHRVRILGGYAPSGLKPTRQLGPNEFEVREDWDIEGGLGYSFRINRTLNIGVEAFTNKSGFLGLGLDF